MNSKHFLGDFINGSFEKTSKPNGTFESVEPGNIKQTLMSWSFEYDHVNTACDSARRAFRGWADFSIGERQEYLNRVKEQVLLHASDLAETLARETGRPLWETQGELAEMAQLFGVYGEGVQHLLQDQKSETGYIHYKPRGVIAIVTPFTRPGVAALSALVPALLTGNTVVFKPSELTAAFAQSLAQIFESAALPKGVFNFVQGDSEVGKRIVMHEAVEAVLFTGSYETGFRIRQDLLPHFWKLASLQMGAKNTAIVWDDADIKKAIAENIVGGFLSSGQRCQSTSRIIVRKAVAERFISGFHSAAKRISIGYPLENPFMGPLISSASLDKYLRFQGIAKREGCESIMRGKVLELGHEGYYVTPSINLVGKADPNSVYQKTEIFGPNVAVYIVEELSEAVQIVNSNSYGLVLSVFTGEEKVFKTCLAQCRVGALNRNIATTVSDPRLPIGGMGKSGSHRTAGISVLLSCVYPVSGVVGALAFDGQYKQPGINLEF